jgi:hypothetical protein
MEKYQKEKDDIKRISIENQEENLKNIYLDFMSIFNCESKEDLIEYLREINPSSKQVCAKKLKRGQGAWVCKDCEKDTSCIICNECYEKSKEKHANHKKFFKSAVSGCCDCGDPDSWDPAGFCSDHQGIITSDEEIKNLINQTFDTNTLLKINEVFESLFSSLAKIIGNYEEQHLECDKNKKAENNYVQIISQALIYMEVLASSNSALLHLIVYFFLQNFEFTTKHNCFKLQSDSKKISETEIKNDHHNCNCSFFQNLIRIWDKTFDQETKIDKLLFTFLKSYKFKYLFGFSYLSLYDTIMINDSEFLRNFSVQVMTIEDIAEVIVSSEDFVNNLFQKLFYLTNYYLNNEEKHQGERYETLFRIIFEFFMDINYLSKPKPAKILSKNITIFKILIDTLSLIQNKIKFLIAKSFQYEGFQENLVSIELYLLYLFSLLTTNFDFNQVQNSEDILFYLLDRIRLKEGNQLSSEEYSFHIPLNRALAIFLNRLAFHYSSSHDLDFFMSIKNILYKYYNYVTLNNFDYKFEDIIGDVCNGTIKFIGFLNSIQCKYWVYYGENMLYYYVLYYAYDQFHLCDFTLLKLFLSQDFSSKFLNLTYFLETSDLKDSYKKNSESLFSQESFVDTPSLNLLEKNLDFFIRLVCSNTYIVDLLAISSDKLSSNRMQDDLLLKVFKKEDGHFKEFVKSRLIHIILRKGNSIYFSEIMKLLPFYLKDSEIINQKAIEDLLDEMCEKIKSGNKPVTFTLKNNYLKKADLYCIIDPKSKILAMKYLIDFKMGEISTLNTPEQDTFDFLHQINHPFNIHFLQKSIDTIICTTSFLLQKINKEEINTNLSLIIDLLKIIDLIIREISHNSYLKHIEDKLKDKDLLDNLTDVKSLDLNFKNCCLYLSERLKILSSSGDYKNSNYLIQENQARKIKTKELKEKVKAIFKEKTKEFRLNFGLLKEPEEIKLNTEKEICEEIVQECIVCRGNIDTNDYASKPFGRIGVFSASSHLFHSKLQTLKKEYEKIVLRNKFKHTKNINSIENEENSHSYGHLLSNEEQLFVKDLMLSYKKSKPEMKKTLRFYTCNHYIHFSCFQTLVLKYYVGNLDNSKGISFICPLCKTISNTFIPCLKKTIKNTNEYSKSNHIDSAIDCSLTFAELFEFYKDILCKNGSNISLADLNFFKIKKFKKIDESLVISLSHFIERVVSLQTKNSFLISDFQKDNNASKIYDLLRNFFLNSINYLDILRNDEYERILDILKEYVLALKVLVKYNILDSQVFFNRLLQIQFYWNTEFSNEDNFSSNIDSDKVSQLFLETIFLILVLLEESELNYLNVIFKHTFPLILIQFFVLQMYINSDFKMNNDKFKEDFKIDNLMFMLISPEYNKPLKNFFIYYLRKAVILKYIFKKDKKIRDSFIDVEAEFDYYCKELNLSLGGHIAIVDFLKQDDIEYPTSSNIVSEGSNKNQENDNKITDINIGNNSYPSFWCFKENTRELTVKLFERYFISKNKSLNDIPNEICKLVSNSNTINNIPTENSSSPPNNFMNNSDNMIGTTFNSSGPGNIVNPSLLLISNNLKFQFISLNNNLLDLSTKYYKQLCHNCNTNPAYAILCLICGEKICYTESCCKNFGKKKNVYEYIWHNKICGSGDGVYLHIYNGEVTLALLGKFVTTKIGLYQNRFGETVKGKSISDDYLLNNDTLSSLLSEYNNLSYRKYFKVSSADYFLVDDDFEEN